MRFNPDIHRRRSIRLKEFDYTSCGIYFFTICTTNREPILATIESGEISLNEWGRIAERTWIDLPRHISNILLDQFTVMPNHVHGIVRIFSPRAGLEPAPTEDAGKPRGLPEIIRQFKTFSARRINRSRKTQGTPVWQRNYFERVIRDDTELTRIRKYIEDNPANWREDEYWQ